MEKKAQYQTPEDYTEIHKLADQDLPLLQGISGISDFKEGLDNFVMAFERLPKHERERFVADIAKAQEKHSKKLTQALNDLSPSAQGIVLELAKSKLKELQKRTGMEDKDIVLPE